MLKFKSFVFIFLLVVACRQKTLESSQVNAVTALPQDTTKTCEFAYAHKLSNLQVLGEGVVTKLLPDDLNGSRHQKFILELANGQTILISHNIDLAPRIADLKVGDKVEFYGEYEWNKQGGVVHWTHKDPQKKHAHGWLKHANKTYE